MSKKYEENNWLKNSEHPILKKIYKKGGALAITDSGELLYRLSKTEPFTNSKSYKAISKSFTSFIGEKVEIIDYKQKKKSTNEEDQDLEDSFPIEPQDLKLVVKMGFDPHANEEFIDNGNDLYTLNIFKPTSFMQQECNTNEHLGSMNAIFALISHICNYNQDRVEWVLNREAYFMQGLKKSQVALVLRGDQGAGKGIFFNEMIKPLYGYTKTINDKSLNSSYKGGLVENTLYFNLDEISVEKSQNESVKNFLKALVTNDTITAEKKFVTLDKETNIYGQVLITSNELEVLEVEQGDRRFTIMNTAGALLQTQFLGYGGYEELSMAIKKELKPFACYLKNLVVDEKKANTALWTPEKDELIHIYKQKQQQKLIKQGIIKPIRLNKLQKNIQEFAYAIKNKQIWQFEPIFFDAPELYEIVIRDFYNNLFKIDNLLPVFKLLYSTSSIKTTTELFKELQKCDMHQFNRSNIVQCKY